MRRHPLRSTLSISLLVTATLSGLLDAHGQPSQRNRAAQDASAPKASTPPGGSYYALVIGNNDYRYVPRLQIALNDADAMERLLRERYGFATRVLLNATRDDTFTALSDYRRSLSPESNLLIYYAGHSYLDRDRDEAYWLPVDARLDNTDKWISADDITRNIRAIRSKHILIISDIYSSVPTRDIPATINPTEHSAYLTRMRASISRTVMTGGSNEPMTEEGRAHSVFANAVLEGLSHMEENEFTGWELFRSIRRKLASQSNGLPQYCVIRNSGDDLGDFVFSGKAPK
jgi:Caspase domain